MPQPRRRGRRAPSRDARRVRGRGHPKRPHLRRLDTDALPHARRPASTSCAPAPTPCSTASTASEPDGGLDACALWVEVTVDLRRRPRSDRDRRGLEDPHIRRRIPTAATASIVGWPDADLHTINEEHGYMDVSRLDERPARRRTPASDPEPRVRLRQPARRPARRARRRRRARDPRRGARARPLAARRTGRARPRGIDAVRGVVRVADLADAARARPSRAGAPPSARGRS